MQGTVQVPSKHLPTTAIPKKWEGKDIYEELFKAFERGEAHQRERDQKEFEAELGKNISKATTLSENIFHTASKDYLVRIIRAYLKVDAVDHFETLFLVDREDYLSEKLLEVYKKSHSVKSDFNSDDFRINFKFMPMSDNLNYDCLYSDGFTLQYGEKQTES